jgi:SAM-dependent methyltransferase
MPEAARRPCPVCGGSERQLLHRQQFAALSDGGLLDGYDVVVCGPCGAAFADRIPAPEAFDRYYRDMSKYEYDHRGGAESPFDLERFRRIARRVGRLVPERSRRILDVGCATGGLLASLRDEGFRDVTGADPSPACAAAAERLYGIRVVTGSLRDDLFPDASFDLLMLIGVLEHLPGPGPAIERLTRLLRPQGAIYVQVPDALQFHLWPNAPFQQFSTEHVNFFSAGSLDNLMAAHGYALIDSEVSAYEWRAGTMDGVVDAVFESTGAARPPRRDAATGAALSEYVRQSVGRDAALCATIERLVREQREILVWGAGTGTQRLLASSRLGEARIRAFVDSNPHYRGRRLHGVPVIGPSDVDDGPTPILIASFPFQREIEDQIRAGLGLRNPVIRLYETDTVV